MAGSNAFGLSIQPSSVTPPPMSTWKNSVAGVSAGATAAASAVLSSSTRTVRWDGQLDEVGHRRAGRSASSVWTANLPSGEIL